MTSKSGLAATLPVENHWASDALHARETGSAQVEVGLGWMPAPAAIPMWIRGYTSGIVAINSAAVQLLGYSRDELKHQSWTDQIKYLTAEQYDRLWADLRHNGTLYVHLTLQTKCGELPVNAVAFHTHVNYSEAALIIVLATGQEAVRRHAVQQRLHRLTQREREVVALIEREGYTCAGVERALQIRKRTVQAHLAHILDKLEVNSVTELIHVLKSIGSMR